MKLIGRRKGREELVLASLAESERWIIEGDFIIVLNGIFGTVPERTAYRIPSDVNKIVEMDNAYEPNTALGIGAPNIINHPV